FGFHGRLVRRWECETDLPKPGPLPQTSQTAATSGTPLSTGNRPDAVGKHVLRARMSRADQPRVTAGGGAPHTAPLVSACRRRRGGRRVAGGWVLRALDAAHVRRWAVACVQSLDAHREAIDRINVFPVADSDTGSNLLHTMRAALDALLRAPTSTRTDAQAAFAALAKGALTGARGNSGVIISQLLRGMADALTTPAQTPSAQVGLPAASAELPTTSAYEVSPTARRSASVGSVELPAEASPAARRPSSVGPAELPAASAELVELPTTSAEEASPAARRSAPVGPAELPTSA